MSFSNIKNLQRTAEKIGILRPESPTSSPHSGKDDKDPFHGIPFWRWDLPSAEHSKLARETNKHCCFNHYIGLPRSNKDDRPCPIYPWQKQIFDAYEEYKYNWILKATGLGVTEFTLRYILWKCVSSDDWQYSWVPIVVGPRIDNAVDSISRMKDMIQDKYPLKNVTQVHFVINKVKVHAFPSNHLETFRSLASVKFILLDEADFFAKKEQWEVRDTSERYIGKSRTRIAMVSTPNRPGGLMERIQYESKSIYHKTFLPFTIGVGTMYSEKDIEAAQESPSFNREYNLEYLGEVGNIFQMADIEYASSILGTAYDPYDEEMIKKYTITRAMGVDPGHGTSQFGIVIQQWVNGFAEVLYAEEMDRASQQECLELVLKLADKYSVMKIYVDSHQSGLIVDLKKKYGEPRNYADIIKKNPKIVDQWIASDPRHGGIRVVPISFKVYHEDMLRHVERILQKKLVRIHPDFTKLLIALRTATSKGERYDLDKEATSHDDILDSFQLSLLNLYLKP